MRWETYPGVVELGLDADHVALLLVLNAEDVELSGAERPNDRVSRGCGIEGENRRTSQRPARLGRNKLAMGDGRWEKERSHGNSATILRGEDGRDLQ